MNDDPLTPEVVEPLLLGRFGRPYRYEPRTGSTQLLVGPDDPEGALAVADEQTAGRGRLGRTWSAASGSALLFSLLLRPPPGPRVPQLALVGGLAVAEAVEEALSRPAQIKWPNDVMVEGRKVAGVLAEAREGVLVLGVGLNVNQTADGLPSDARVRPTSLRMIDAVERERALVLADVLLRLETLYDAWIERGLDSVRSGLDARDFLRDRRVTVDGRSGVGGGIDREGRLIIDGQPVSSGEVEFRN